MSLSGHIPNAAVRSILTVLMMIVASPFLAAAHAESVSGGWELTVETPQGAANPTIDITQDGEKLSGTYTGRLGKSELHGSVKGNEIRFSVKLTVRDQDFIVTYTGRIEGGSMSGTVQFGDSSSGKWSARRRS
jgi:hypothetical protein